MCELGESKIISIDIGPCALHKAGGQQAQASCYGKMKAARSLEAFERPACSQKIYKARTVGNSTEHC